MKTVLFTLTLLFVAFSVQADFEPIFCYKGTIITRDHRTVTGYFIFNEIHLNQDSAGYFYYDKATPMRLKILKDTARWALLINEMEYHFFNHVKRVARDTLRVYEHAVFISQSEEMMNPQIGCFMGKNHKISAAEILEITMQEIYAISSITEVMTRLHESDLQWLKPIRAIPYEEVGHTEEFCRLEAMSFDKEQERLAENLHRLTALVEEHYKLAARESRKDNQQKLKTAWQAILDEIERLRSLKIIVTLSCSC